MPDWRAELVFYGSVCNKSDYEALFLLVDTGCSKLLLTLPRPNKKGKVTVSDIADFKTQKSGNTTSVNFSQLTHWQQ